MNIEKLNNGMALFGLSMSSRRSTYSEPYSSRLRQTLSIPSHPQYPFIRDGQLSLSINDDDNYIEDQELSKLEI